MISIGATANFCCFCTNKAKTSNIITYSHNTCTNRVVVWCNWKKHLTTGSGGGARIVTPPRWLCRWCNVNNDNLPLTSRATRGGRTEATVLVLLLIFSGMAANAASIEQSMDTFSNVPQTLSGEDRKRPRIQHPKSRDAERCTIKCVTTCIRGGAGSPGEGPLNARRPLVVFKEGFRSRQYCLVECSDICNLIKDGDDGP